MLLLNTLHEKTNAIIHTAATEPGNIYTACNDLYQWLIDIVLLDENSTENRDNVLLDTGSALGTTWAAKCIQDFMRTKKFMDGVYAAANDVKKQQRQTPLHILYAGTGPFATLVLPLLATFTSNELQFTFLEINEHSYAILRQLIATLKLEKYIHNIEMADAAKWTLPKGEQVDIFISETMLAGLQKEPQVAIYMNIVPQLAAHTILIPTEIVLSAGLINHAKFHEARMNNENCREAIKELGTVFCLNKKTITHHSQPYQLQMNHYTFPAQEVVLSKAHLEAYKHLYIFTDITIYENVQMKLNESSLTMPLKVKNMQALVEGTASFEYQISKMPGLNFSFVPA